MRTPTATSSTSGMRASPSVRTTGRSTTSTCRGRRNTSGALHSAKDLPQLLNPAGGTSRTRTTRPGSRRCLAARPGAVSELFRARRTGASGRTCAGHARGAREVLGGGREAVEVRYEAAVAERVKPALLAAISQGCRRRQKNWPRRAPCSRRGTRARRPGAAARCSSSGSGKPIAPRSGSRSPNRGTASGRRRRPGHRQCRPGAHAPGRRGQMDAHDLRRGGRCLGRRLSLPLRRSRSPGGGHGTRRHRVPPVERVPRPAVSTAPPGSGDSTRALPAGPNVIGSSRASATGGCCSCTSPDRCRPSPCWPTARRPTAPRLTAATSIRIFANRDLRPACYTEADIAAHLERQVPARTNEVTGPADPSNPGSCILIPAS